jgi:dolichol kinase
LVSLRVDDNFSIPLSAAAGLGLVATLLHVAL